jgi:hypothetical protein
MLRKKKEVVPKMLIRKKNVYEKRVREYGSQRDVRGSVHYSIIHIENPTRCNSVSKFLFHIYMKLNMFRATRRPSSGA